MHSHLSIQAKYLKSVIADFSAPAHFALFASWCTTAALHLFVLEDLVSCDAQQVLLPLLPLLPPRLSQLVSCHLVPRDGCSLRADILRALANLQGAIRPGFPVPGRGLSPQAGVCNHRCVLARSQQAAVLRRAWAPGRRRYCPASHLRPAQVRQLQASRSKHVRSDRGRARAKLDHLPSLAARSGCAPCLHCTVHESATTNV